ncbi:hypothetical protein U2A4042580067 [Corynebacterium striatum]|nr:hypothetical protein U2A4042580067 [Corynebacterium striatum]
MSQKDENRVLKEMLKRVETIRC